MVVRDDLARGFMERAEGFVGMLANAGNMLRMASALAPWLKLSGDSVGTLAKVLDKFLGGRGTDMSSVYRAGLFVMSNLAAIQRGEDPWEAGEKAMKEGHWTIVQCVSVVYGGRNSKGRRQWSASFAILWGPLAGTGFTIRSSDAWLCGVVRDVSGAKYSRTVAGVDLSGMRLRVFVKAGGSTIESIDSSWAAGRRINSEIRRQREGCPRGPCEKCGRTRDECRWSSNQRK